MWDTPEDCTAVVQVMEEYERLARPTIIGRLNFDETPSPKFSSSFKAQTNNKSSKTDYSFARRSSKDREKDVALLCAKGKISQLENESKLMMTERKRARIEQDKEGEIHQGNLRREIEKNSELQQQLKYVFNQEKNVRDELKGTRKEFEDYKKKAEEKIHGLQRQMLKLNSEVEESKEGFWRQLTEMREKLTRQETEKIIAQNKLADNENQLEYYK
ncbi:Hypothetical predicted protein, partial [Paramuricea clavata]